MAKAKRKRSAVKFRTDHSKGRRKTACLSASDLKTLAKFDKAIAKLRKGVVKTIDRNAVKIYHASIWEGFNHVVEGSGPSKPKATAAAWKQFNALGLKKHRGLTVRYTIQKVNG